MVTVLLWPAPTTAVGHIQNVLDGRWHCSCRNGDALCLRTHSARPTSEANSLVNQEEVRQGNEAWVPGPKRERFCKKSHGALTTGKPTTP